MEQMLVGKSDIVTGSHPPELREQARHFRRNMTPAEKRLWASLRAGRLAGLHFRRQQVIDHFIVDFYCHAAGLVVEVDGEVHGDQGERDANRDGLLAGRGLLILRFANRQIMNSLPAVLREIRVAAQARLGPGPQRADMPAPPPGRPTAIPGSARNPGPER